MNVYFHSKLLSKATLLLWKGPERLRLTFFVVVFAMISGVDEAELLSVYIISGCHLLLCVSSHVNAPKKILYVRHCRLLRNTSVRQSFRWFWCVNFINPKTATATVWKWRQENDGKVQQKRIWIIKVSLSFRLRKPELQKSIWVVNKFSILGNFVCFFFILNFKLTRFQHFFEFIQQLKRKLHSNHICILYYFPKFLYQSSWRRHSTPVKGAFDAKKVVATPKPSLFYAGSSGGKEQ